MRPVRWRKDAEPVRRERTGPVVPEVPVAFSSVDVFRAERFPDAGPRPWLDQPGAKRVVRSKVRSGAITREEGEYLFRRCFRLQLPRVDT